MKLVTAIMVTAAMISPLWAYTGGAGRNHMERNQNRKQVSEGKKNLQRDGEEIKQFQADLEKYAKAAPEEQAEIEKRILGSMEREIGQTEKMVAQAQREVKQSTREVRSDRRELQHDRDDVGRYESQDDRNDMARDRANKIDDQVDRVDDAVDVKKLAGVLENQKKIYAAAQQKFTVELAQQFAKVTGALIDLQKAELQEDQKERVEDVRETSDDRRERREEPEPADYYRRRR